MWKQRNWTVIFSEELKHAERVFSRTSVSQPVETFLKYVCVRRDKATVFLSWHSAEQHYVCLIHSPQTVLCRTRSCCGLFTGWDQFKSEFSVQRASCASVTSCFLPLLHKSIKTLNHSLKSDDLLSVFKVRQSGPIKNPHWFCRVKLNFSCVLELQARWLLARHWIHTFPFHSFNHKLIDLFMVLSRWIKTVFFLYSFHLSSESVISWIKMRNENHPLIFRGTFVQKCKTKYFI